MDDDGSAATRSRVDVATRSRRVLAALTLLTGGVFLVASLGLDVGSSARPGPGLVPRLVAVGLTVAGLLALVQRVPATADLDDLPDAGGGRRQALVLGALSGYILTLPVIGFLLSTAVTMSVCSAATAPKRNARRAILIGVATALTIDWTFRVLLRVNLPVGLWGISLA